MLRRRKERTPPQNEIIEACIKKVREEFKDRVPVVRTYFSKGKSFYGAPTLRIEYFVETAAMEDSIDSKTYRELQDRTRDELLFMGYFRERKDEVSVLVYSEERVKNDKYYYIRGGVRGQT
jgi:hypothetical protein